MSTMSLLNGLVSYWKFDEVSGNAIDSVGSNDLVPFNGVTYVAGKQGNAAHFKSSLSQYLAITNLAQNGLSPQVFSVSAWFKFDTLTSYQTIFAKSYKTTSISPGFSYGVYADFTNNTITINVGYSTTTWLFNAIPFAFVAGVYYHLVFHLDGSFVYLYINNSLIAKVVQAHPVLYSDGDFWIGDDITVDPFNGSIDEVGFWSRILSASEVSELYYKGYCLPFPFLISSTAPVTLATVNSAQANGSVLMIPSGVFDTRGFVFGTVSFANPGNVAPSLSGYAGYTSVLGSFGIGSYSDILATLLSGTKYFVRFWVHNSAGYLYADEVSFLTSTPYRVPFTNLPGITFNVGDTSTIYAEQLNDMLSRLHALDGG